MATTVMGFDFRYSWGESSVLVRWLLAFLLVVGAPVGVRGPEDPALVLARAAGALCQAGGSDGVPQDGHRHDACLICKGGVPVGVLPEMPVLFAGGVAVTRAAAVLVQQVWAAGRAGYVSRAPPGGVG